jgi:hypothetical protein
MAARGGVLRRENTSGEVTVIDYDMLMGTVFVLLLAMIIGGTFLLYPVSRKLGALLDANTQEKKAASGSRPKEIEEILTRLSAVELQIQSSAERQEFLERLLMHRQQAAELSAGQREAAPAGETAMREERAAPREERPTGRRPPGG